MLVSTVLGRFVIPVYYVLGERIGDWLKGTKTAPDETTNLAHNHE